MAGGRTSARAKELLAATKKASAAARPAFEAPAEPTALPVHRRVVLNEDGEGESTSTVFCRRRGGATNVKDCAGCAHVVSVPEDGHGGEVRCLMDKQVAHKRDAAELAIRTYVGEIMRRQVTCVKGDATWETLEDLLLDEDNDAIVVVDALSRPTGIVSKSDLLRYLRNEPPNDPAPRGMLERGFHLESPKAVAQEIMTPVVQTLFETAPLSFAVAVLAQKGVEQAPVVAVDGAVIGMIAATDVVGWMAHQLGYER
jgi:CBS domain-containing protein